MSDKKISELTALTAPDGAEELVVNDSGTSKKITQTNLLSTALPLAGGTMTGTIAGFTSTGIDDNATSTAITIGSDSIVSFSNNIDVDTATSGGYAIKFKNPSSDSGTTGFIYDNNQDNLEITTSDPSYALTFKTSNLERMRIGSTGNVEVSTGNLVIGTSGKGIDFSATSDGSGTMTSEVLDDYEEGTWTPVIKDQSGSTSASFTHAHSTYTKIGRMVTIFTNLTAISSVGLAASEDVRVYGVPFNATTPGVGAVNMENVDYKDTFTDTESVTTYIGGAYLYFRVNRNNGGSQGLEGGDLNSLTSGFAFTLTYMAA